MEKMTEQMAIDAIRNDLKWHSKELKSKYKEVLEYAIQALEEIQQYRTIGTVEEIQSMKDHLFMVSGMCKDYYEIGTVEEFKALKEKSVAKKPLGLSATYEGRVGNCPCCYKFVAVQKDKHYCKCGQHLDWE